MRRTSPPNPLSAYRLTVRLGLLTLLLLAVTVAHPASRQDIGIADSAMEQIVAVEQFKQTFTPAEQKMSFNLVLASRLAQGQAIPSFLVSQAIGDQRDGLGRFNVDIRTDGTDIVAANIAASGGQVTDQNSNEQHVRAFVAPAQLLQMASDPNVSWIHDADRATTNVGAVTSQAYVSHTANKAWAALGGASMAGYGMKVGVLSDSATAARVAALIASGDLPADVTVLPGQEGPASGSNEGTAMMEIIYDLAPAAKLFFATAFNGQASFAQNIRDLHFVYGCNIIVDDVTYFAEGAFQDGTIAKAVNDVVADGALYFSSAANSGNLTLGTSGTWEGDYKTGPAVTAANPIGAAGETGYFHDFGVSNLYDTLTAATTFISLKWSDPLAGACNDYDLFILNSTGTAIVTNGTSAGAQTCTQDPFEAVSSSSGFPANSRVVVVLYSGAQRALRVDTNRGRLSIRTTGSTFGHNAGLNTVTMAATYWNSARTGTQPFVGGAANPIETFSSDGPRKIFYNPDGSAITPGNVLFATAGGVTLQKPDFTAADGGSAKTPGFLPFFGTSAAAPHAAAVAALAWSAKPSLTNAQVYNILKTTALDNMAVGADRDGGYGIVMALPAVQKAKQ
jgi:hypothetical protein